jgi:hypothetical protein
VLDIQPEAFDQDPGRSVGRRCVVGEESSSGFHVLDGLEQQFHRPIPFQPRLSSQSWTIRTGAFRI